MAIQFFCPSCGKPIEVDDDVANMAVTCPYCRKVFTAPASSDPTISAPPSAIGPRPMEAPLLPPTLVAPTPRGNRLSWTSLVMMLLWIGAIVMLNMVVLKIVGKIDGPVEPEELNDRVKKGLEAHPGLALPALLGMIGTCALPLIVLATAIGALAKRRPPLWPAIVSLCLMGAVVLILFLGALAMRGRAGVG